MGRPPTSVLVSYVKKQQQGRGIRKRKKVRRGRKGKEYSFEKCAKTFFLDHILFINILITRTTPLIFHSTDSQFKKIQIDKFNVSMTSLN